MCPWDAGRRAALAARSRAPRPWDAAPSVLVCFASPSRAPQEKASSFTIDLTPANAEDELIAPAEFVSPPLTQLLRRGPLAQAGRPR